MVLQPSFVQDECTSHKLPDERESSTVNASSVARRVVMKAHVGAIDQQLSDDMFQRLQVQGDECVIDGLGGLGNNLMRWHSRRRVECAGDQVVSTDGRRRPQASCVNRVVRGRDSIHKDSGRILSRAPNTGHVVVVQVREQLWEYHGKTLARWIMSTQLVWRSTVDHATTVSAGI